MIRAPAKRKPQEMTTEERRAAIWAAMRDQGESDWSIRDITRATDIPRWTVKDLADRLVLAGYATCEEGERGLRFKLLGVVGVIPPRLRPDGTPAVQGGGQLNLWRSMRVLREFSVLDLVGSSTTPEVRVSVKAAREYCRRLTLAGYLRRPPRSLAGGGVRYLLIRDTGPRPPRVRRDGTVEDPNTGETHPTRTEETAS